MIPRAIGYVFTHDFFAQKLSPACVPTHDFFMQPLSKANLAIFKSEAVLKVVSRKAREARKENFCTDFQNFALIAALRENKVVPPKAREDAKKIPTRTFKTLHSLRALPKIKLFHAKPAKTQRKFQH
jgi:hypothetical protein